jgi:glucokinase
MFPFIVADIGGTNARFALATGRKDDQIQIEEARTLNGRDFPTFEEALDAYSGTLNGIKPRAACVAIAGPVGEDQVSMTNLSWNFSLSETRQRFGFEKFVAMNDFAAQAVAASELQGDDLLAVKAGQINPIGNKAIFGPGTGLGVAGLAHHKGDWIPIPSEGGHVNIAPATDVECEIIKAAMKRWGHVSAERFISGPGLVNLYETVAEVRGEQPRTLEPKDVTAGALAGSDPLCVETLQVFCSLLGSLAGNLALTYGASGGVYMAGGILPRFAEFLQQSTFSERFTEKGVMSKYVKDIPAYLVVRPNAAFLGAAAWLLQQ